MRVEGKLSGRSSKHLRIPIEMGVDLLLKTTSTSKKNHISCTRGFRWGVTRRVADICCLFFRSGGNVDFSKVPPGAKRRRGTKEEENLPSSQTK